MQQKCHSERRKGAWQSRGWIASSLLLLAMTLLLVFPSHAQEDADAVLAETGGAEEQVEASETGFEKRLTLSRQMHEIWPIRPKVERAIDSIAENVPPAERAKFKATMRSAIKFKALEEASVDAMADIFTEKELQAMIDFYGSKEGRSVSFKVGDYERALEPLMIKMIDKALLDARLGQAQ